MKWASHHCTASLKLSNAGQPPPLSHAESCAMTPFADSRMRTMSDAAPSPAHDIVKIRNAFPVAGCG
jgi:hypothetical protein